MNQHTGATRHAGAADAFGALGVRRLQQIWSNALAARQGAPRPRDPIEFHLDHGGRRGCRPAPIRAGRI
ncbi:MAG: hypothetical protein ABSG76_18330 [Xanthobacteraceae bacterium]|jgi:hypothetical protein